MFLRVLESNEPVMSDSGSYVRAYRATSGVLEHSFWDPCWQRFRARGSSSTKKKSLHIKSVVVVVVHEGVGRRSRGGGTLV